MNEQIARKMDEAAQALFQDVKAYREHIHQHPELSLQEHKTTAFIEGRLKEWGYAPFRPDTLETGAVAILEGKGERKAGAPSVVALRADIDALPIVEETGAPYASRERANFQGQDVGVMHACGHDGHAAVLLGLAHAFKQMEDEVPGTVKFIFQPGEEGGGGGRLMAEGGVLKDPDVDAIFALHGRHHLPVGFVQLAEYPNAATDAFEIDVIGRGGHGAYPHMTLDPIPVAAQIVTAIQTLVSRRVPAGKPAVVTVGAFQAGTTSNVIPDKVHMKGTIRTLQPEIRDLIVDSMTAMVEGIASACGAKAELRVDQGYPSVRCDRRLLDFVGATATDLFGPDLVEEALDQAMGGEDFSYYLDDQGGVPGVIFRIGTGCPHNQHTSRFDFGSDVIVPAMRILGHVALRYLSGEAGTP